MGLDRLGNALKPRTGVLGYLHLRLRRRDLTLLLCFARLAVFHRRLEVADAFAETFTKVGEAARAKDEQRDRENDEYFRKTKFKRHFAPSLKRTCLGKLYRGDALILGLSTN
jgi:hypothetical protein